MSSLRWILLVLGALVIVGVYLWGRGWLRRPELERFSRSRRIEPPPLDGSTVDDAARGDGTGEEDSDASGVEPDDDAAASTIAPEPAPAPRTERIVTVRLVPKESRLGGQEAVLALRAAGLTHGRYGIFHMLGDDGSQEPWFSVANLTEPGSFDLNRIAETTIPGMSFFMILPGTGDPVERFDRMVDTARTLARDWDAELHDDRGSSWSIQRERYVREEIIQYRHQLERA